MREMKVLVVLTVILNVACWTPVERGVTVEHDFIKAPLEIWTYGKLEEPGILSVQFSTALDKGIEAGGLEINFERKTYRLLKCFDWKSLPGSAPSEPKFKVWRITLDYGSNTDVTIHCNDIELTRFTTTQSDCLATGPDWSTFWRDRKAKAIKFTSTDGVTGGYRHYSTAASVLCSGKEMALLRGKVNNCASSIYLLKSGDKDCVFDGDKKVISTEIHQCQTVVSYNDSHVIYQNMAKCGDPNAHANSITRDEGESIQIKFHCSYKRIGKVSNPQWSAQGETTVELGGEGYLEFVFEVYDSTYTKAKTATDYPLKLYLNSDLHMQLSVDTTDTAMSLHIVDVKATTSATDSEDYSGLTYYMWKDGCKKDSSAAEVPQLPDDPTRKRFKIKVFKFLATDDDIYIHAKVRVCGTDKTSCTFSCSKRKRRSADAENETISKDYGVFLGPFITTDQTVEELAVAVDPVDQLVEVGKETTMSCVSISTPVTVTKVEWFTKDGVQFTDSNPATKDGAQQGTKTYTSSYKITGATGMNKNSYQCRMIVDAQKKAESKSATVYIVGIKSLVAEFDGKYFESDGGGNADFSETAKINFEAYVGPGIKSQTGSLVKDGTTDKVTITFTAAPESNDVIAYSHTIVEENKQTGTYTVSVTYNKGSSANGGDTYTKTYKLPVYQFCKTAALPTDTGGTWSPTEKVEHRGYATLSCGDGKYVKGDGIVQCLMGSSSSEFTEFTTKPSCNSYSELLDKCGLLTAPGNGDVVYENENSAYFVCDTGFTLVGAEPKYTCNTAMKAWSIVTSDNPRGLPPTCQTVQKAESRVVTVSDMKITTNAELCKDADERERVSEALQKAMEEDDILKCTKNHFCAWGEFSCVYDSGTLTVGFKLTQTYSLEEKLVMTQDAARITAKVSTIEFEVNDGTKKRALVSASARATTTTKCPAGSALIDNSCSQCPPGYGYGGDTCSTCVIGQYSTGNSVSACSTCAGGKTTYHKGTTSAMGCVLESEVCVVGGSTSSAVFVPPTGSRIPYNQLISVSCRVGQALAFGVPPTFKCGSPAPTCHEMCSLTELSTDELNKKFIHAEEVKKKGQLVENEQITVPCMTGYEIRENVPAQTYTCSGGSVPPFAACVAAKKDEDETKYSSTSCLQAKATLLAGLTALLLLI